MEEPLPSETREEMSEAQPSGEDEDDDCTFERLARDQGDNREEGELDHRRHKHSARKRNGAKHVGYSERMS